MHRCARRVIKMEREDEDVIKGVIDYAMGLDERSFKLVEFCFWVS